MHLDVIGSPLTTKTFPIYCMKINLPALTKKLWTILSGYGVRAASEGKVLWKKLWPIVKKSATWAYQKILWLGEKTWKAGKKYAKWTWKHKKEKKVLVSACVIAVFGILIFGVFGFSYVTGVARQALSGITTSTISTGMIILLVLGIMVVGIPLVVLELLVWALVKQGEQQGKPWAKTLKKAHTIIVALIAAILAIVYMATSIPWRKMGAWVADTFEKGFEYYIQTIPYPLATTLGFICVVSLLVLWWRKSKHTSATSATAVAHEGHGSRSTLQVIIAWALVLIAISFIVSLAGLGWELNQNSLQRQQVAGFGQVQSVDQSFRVFARPGEITTLTVGKGTNICWTIEGPGHIFFRRNDEPEQEDWAEQQIRLSNIHADRIF